MTRRPALAPLALALAAALTLGAPGPAAAEMSADQKAQLTAELAAYDPFDMEVGDPFEGVPPRVLDAMARSYGLSIDDLRELTAQALRASVPGFEMHAGRFAIEDITYGTTRAGRDYALFRQELDVTIEGRRVAVTAWHLAFFENGKLYQVHAGIKSTKDFLDRSYPDFAAVRVPTDTIND